MIRRCVTNVMSIELDERGRALENEYFHRKDKELLEKMRERVASESAKQLELKCPKCDGQLVETEQDGVAIDICNKCSGVWLDAGELAQLVAKSEDKGWFGGLFG